MCYPGMWHGLVTGLLGTEADCKTSLDYQNNNIYMKASSQGLICLLSSDKILCSV